MMIQYIDRYTKPLLPQTPYIYIDIYIVTRIIYGSSGFSVSAKYYFRSSFSLSPLHIYAEVKS